MAIRGADPVRAEEAGAVAGAAPGADDPEADGHGLQHLQPCLVPGELVEVWVEEGGDLQGFGDEFVFRVLQSLSQGQAVQLAEERGTDLSVCVVEKGAEAAERARVAVRGAEAKMAVSMKK